MKRLRSFFGIIAIVLAGCETNGIKQDLPSTLGERLNSSSYIPFDPLPVYSDRGRSCERNESVVFKELLDSLPDQTVRIAVAEYDQSGTLVFGPVKIGGEGKSYQVVLDYVSVDATNIPVYVERYTNGPNGDKKEISLFEDVPINTQYRVHLDPDSDAFLYGEKTAISIPPGERVIIPVYVGVGLRLTANVTVTKGSANLSSLGSIAADAEAGKLTGSLVVQTLGITGKSVSTSLPLPSELNQTTIQNAILSLGSIKAVLYDKANTIVTPRVVGIYNPIGGGQQLVNGVMSVLANEPIRWKRPCVDPTQNITSQASGTP